MSFQNLNVTELFNILVYHGIQTVWKLRLFFLPQNGQCLEKTYASYEDMKNEPTDYVQMTYVSSVSLKISVYFPQKFQDMTSI